MQRGEAWWAGNPESRQVWLLVHTVRKEGQGCDEPREVTMSVLGPLRPLWPLNSPKPWFPIRKMQAGKGIGKYKQANASNIF